MPTYEKLIPIGIAYICMRFTLVRYGLGGEVVMDGVSGPMPVADIVRRCFRYVQYNIIKVI